MTKAEEIIPTLSNSVSPWATAWFDQMVLVHVDHHISNEAATGWFTFQWHPRNSTNHESFKATCCKDNMKILDQSFLGCVGESSLLLEHVWPPAWTWDDHHVMHICIGGGPVRQHNMAFTADELYVHSYGVCTKSPVLSLVHLETFPKLAISKLFWLAASVMFLPVSHWELPC